MQINRRLNNILRLLRLEAFAGNSKLIRLELHLFFRGARNS
jgi:hypothetical protein